MKWSETYQFADPWILWFLVVIPAIVIWYVQYGMKRNTQFASSVSMSDDLWKMKSGNFIKPILFALRMFAFLMLIVALARPQVRVDSQSYIEQYKEGIDIVIALDASGSMLAQDFTPDRFQASKAVAQEFVSERPNDRVGLVIFEGEAYTQCPLTSDSKIIGELIGEAEQGVVNQGTAIGMGLATAVNRLRESEAKSKVIILLTDGVNTHGKIHPLAAAEMAKEFGIRVYTIGVGTNGKAKTPVDMNPFTGKYIYDYVDVEIDETTLKEISKATGGMYFRATDNETLKLIYDEIDQLEKAKFKAIEFEMDLPEKSMPLVVFALSIFLFEIFGSVLFKSLS